MVAVDVGIMKLPNSIYDAVVILCYQWWFASAYITSQLFAKWLGQVVFSMYFVFVYIFKFMRIEKGGRAPRDLKEIHGTSATSAITTTITMILKLQTVCVIYYTYARNKS